MSLSATEDDLHDFRIMFYTV